MRYPQQLLFHRHRRTVRLPPSPVPRGLLLIHPPACSTSASVANQPDYVLVSSTPFNASHNHDAPFLPLSLEAENLRRSTLAPNDPSLLTPPLLTAGELSSFLEALNPDLLAYFPLLESAGISPTMRLAELYDLGEKDFTESMDDVGMPLFAKVEIVSGVTRAGRRVSAGEGVWDGRPARGKKLARAMEWIESAIAQGAVAMQSTSGGGQSRL